jgi:hypothetical protein
MNDTVPMQITQCAADLPRKLPGGAFTQAAVSNDVIKHLPAIDVFLNHIVVVLLEEGVSKDVWKQKRSQSLLGKKF